MPGRTDGLIKNMKASGAVAARRIVKFGAGDTLAVQAAASTDALIGVSGEIDVADTEPCDVHLGELAEVVYGGNVTRGDQLTSDANGKAITAAPGAGVNARTIGIAMASGVLNDIGLVRISPGSTQG